MGNLGARWGRVLCGAILFLACSGSVSVAQAAGRVPRPSERRELIRAVDELRSYGFYETADRLDQMLIRNAILVDDHFEKSLHALTTYPIIGDQKIILNAGIIPDPAAPVYARPKLGGWYLLEERVWLLSILAHEWHHTTQPPLWVRTVGRSYSRLEKPAWMFQVDVLRRAYERCPDRSPFMLSRLDMLVDRAQGEVDEL